MTLPRDSRYDRRIEEIERELKRVQKTMREVESGRRRIEPVPAATSSPRAHPWRSPAGDTRETTAPSGAATTPAQGDLFHSPIHRGAASPAASSEIESRTARPLAHYLSSGGFMGSPLRRDQRHFKAKAIFMLVVLLLMIYVVWWLLR